MNFAEKFEEVCGPLDGWRVSRQSLAGFCCDGDPPHWCADNTEGADLERYRAHVRVRSLLIEGWLQGLSCVALDQVWGATATDTWWSVWASHSVNRREGSTSRCLLDTSVHGA